MNIEKFKEIIKERKRISIETQDEWDYGIEQCWKQEIEIMSEDILGAITYLQNECTKDEFVYLSEVIIDIVERTHNANFLESYKLLAERYSEESVNYYIADIIKDAEIVVYGGGDGGNC